MNVTDTLPDWNALPGTTLDGGYELKEIVEAEGERASLRVRVLGDYSLKATAHFYTLEPDKAREEAAIWQSLRRSPRGNNLDVPLGAGVLSLNGVTLAYVVLQIPDETLENVLASRTLDADETVDVLRAIARGLSGLQNNSYIHGSVSPDQVLALDNEIRLSCEPARKSDEQPLISGQAGRYLAPESSTYNTTAAADIWCLAATVFESIAGKKYEAALYDEATQFKHPIGTLLEKALAEEPDKRPKLGELESILRSKAPPAKPRPVPVAVPPPESFKTATAAAPGSNGNGAHITLEPAAADHPVSPASSISAPVSVPSLAASSSSASAAATAPALEPVKTVEPVRDVEPVKSEAPVASVDPIRTSAPRNAPSPAREARSFQFAPSVRRPAPERPALSGEEDSRNAAQRRSWIYAISAFVAIFFALLFLRYYSHSVANRSAKIIRQTAVVAPPGAAWPTKTLSPDKTAPPNGQAATPVTASASAANAASAHSPGSSARTIWRVVLYTYGREEDANRKAHDLNGKHPDLHASTFSPTGSGAPFLVIAGGPMSREAASQLRSRALREGMPRDTYTQNFDH